MLRQTIILLTFLIFSCDNRKCGEVKFGCDPPCEDKEWLSFQYDKAILYHDTTSDIKSAIDSKTLAAFTAHHSGQTISEDAIKNLNDALSCRLWTCTKTPTEQRLFNPDNIIIFIKDNLPVAHIVTCSKSNIVDCVPDSDNKEISTIDAIVFRILSTDE